ncbi:MAG: cysteine desulfurase [Bacteroidetes bacterium]|nr:cysteine desulfurase [Bacteroidota bacterium]MCH8940817.1 cysteine desulfurase [Bacteroidota bacterium]
MLNIEKIRNDFPILKQLIHNKPLCYLDNAASTQKPQIVIDTINNFYSTTNSNIHRGVHYLSEKSTQAFENARIKVKDFINAKSEKEIIFTSGTTASINLVAQSFGRKYLNEDDEIIVTTMEHHSNIVPWQLLCDEKNANLKVVKINDIGELLLDSLNDLISEKTKLISVMHVSNTLGTINPIKEIIKIAHQNNVPVLLDAAQSIQHIEIDVQELDCDFLAFSGHKIYGPTGIGILYGKENLLDEMPPFMGGGDMISKVTFEETTFNELPFKFEAGTSNIAGAIGLGAAIDYVKSIGIENIKEYETNLLNAATDAVKEIPGIKIIGNAKEKTSVLSFVIDNIHPHDIGTFLDFEGVAIRTGHHCTQPLMDFFKIPATSRASFAFYNTLEEVEQLTIALKKTIEVFN